MGMQRPPSNNYPSPHDSISEQDLDDDELQEMVIRSRLDSFDLRNKLDMRDIGEYATMTETYRRDNKMKTRLRSSDHPATKISPLVGSDAPIKKETRNKAQKTKVFPFKDHPAILTPRESYLRRKNKTKHNTTASQFKDDFTLMSPSLVNTNIQEKCCIPPNFTCYDDNGYVRSVNSTHKTNKNIKKDDSETASRPPQHNASTKGSSRGQEYHSCEYTEQEDKNVVVSLEEKGKECLTSLVTSPKYDCGTQQVYQYVDEGVCEGNEILTVNVKHFNYQQPKSVESDEDPTFEYMNSENSSEDSCETTKPFEFIEIPKETSQEQHQHTSNDDDDMTSITTQASIHDDNFSDYESDVENITSLSEREGYDMNRSMSNSLSYRDGKNPILTKQRMMIPIGNAPRVELTYNASDDTFKKLPFSSSSTSRHSTNSRIIQKGIGRLTRNSKKSSAATASTKIKYLNETSGGRQQKMDKNQQRQTFKIYSGSRSSSSGSLSSKLTRIISNNKNGEGESVGLRQRIRNHFSPIRHRGQYLHDNKTDEEEQPKEKRYYKKRNERKNKIPLSPNYKYQRGNLEVEV